MLGKLLLPKAKTSLWKTFVSNFYVTTGPYSPGEFLLIYFRKNSVSDGET